MNKGTEQQTDTPRCSQPVQSAIGNLLEALLMPMLRANMSHTVESLGFGVCG